MNRKLIFSVLAAVLLGACDTPQIPLGSINPNPIPSEAPANDEPPCLQTLQCIVDNTNNNGLRKQTQEIINQLFVTAEPDYTRLCQSRSSEFVERVPECQK